MKQRIISIVAVLALCLSLLPGTAWAVDETPTGIKFEYQDKSVTLTDGKTYVAAEENKGITEWTGEGEPTDPYLSYSGTTLTVHGAFATTAVVIVNSDLTITGGADSSLTVTAPYGNTICLGNNSTLTLDGGVNFTAINSSGPVINYSQTNSTGTFGAANSYSGGIVLRSGDGAPAVYGVPLDVQNSGSITIVGMMTSMESAVLSSKGKVSITSSSGPILPRELTIKGANVELINNNDSGSSVFSGQSLNIEATGNVLITNKTEGTYTASALAGSAVISAGGDVEISSNGIPAAAPYSTGATYDLTVKNAKSVSITGSSGTYDAFFSVPVTFEKCGSVTVTDSGSRPLIGLMADNVTVTSDKPWTATKSGGDSVTLPSGEWHYGGATTDTQNQYVLSLSSTGSAPTCWKAGEGWIYYEPAADGSSPNKLTLDNATYESSIRASNTNDLTVTAKGSNQIREIAIDGRGSGSVTVKTEGGGTLNTVVSQRDSTNLKLSNTVYGKVELTTGYALGPNGGGVETSMTIAPGAEATIPSNANLSIFDTTYLTNNGTIVNNGTVTLKDTAAASADAETVKNLGLTGSGSVKVEKENPDGGDPVTDTYTNSGVKFLDPAGALDLSAKKSNEENADQGYKWEVTKGQDDSGNEIITSAKLTLAPGFNATSVKLPDAAVTIETTGESRIGELSAGSGPDNAKLTFSGKGPLTVDERINIAGGAGNTITVAAGAQVTANNGIYVGITGEDSITVNGTLKAKSLTDPVGSAPAISVGKVSVGTTGILEVSGENGVELHGVGSNGLLDFSNLFTITEDGRFTANCSEYNVRVQSSGNFPEGTTAEGAINLGPEYMPEGCKVVLYKDTKQIQLVRISDGAEFTGPLTIHKNHTWSSAWTADGDNGHYHACTFEGCTAKNDERPHYYAHLATECRDCHYPRPAGTPDSDSGSSGGSSGGGSDRDDSYTVTVERPTHGTVTSNRRTASRGDTVTLTVTADSGYALDTLTVTDSRGNDVAVTEKDNGKYTFTMPDRAVTVSAAFIRSAAGAEVCPKDSTCPISPYTDASTTAWYHDGVHYCLENGLMSGYGSGLFGPSDTLSRAQFAQILYNRAGRPAAAGGSPFADVPSGAWYAPAVTWAASEGIVEGRGDGTFGPREPVTREQLAVMLWRYAGSPAASGSAPDFSDADRVSGYAREAVRWAVEQGILQGRGGGILAPRGEATRAEVAALFMRYLSR